MAFLVCIQMLVRGHRRVCQNDKAQVSAMYMLFYYIGASTFGTIGGTFLSNYGWSGIVVFETVILTIGLILAIILYKKKE